MFEEMHGDSVPTFAGKLQLVVSPQAARAVRAVTPIGVREMRLVPFSSTLMCTKPGEKVPQANVDLGFAYTHHESQKDVNVFVCQRTQTFEEGKPELLVPFWLVGTTNDAAKANVQLKLVKSKLDESWFVPCLVNHRALDKGDALCAFVKSGRGRYAPMDELEEKEESAKKRRKLKREQANA